MRAVWLVAAPSEGSCRLFQGKLHQLRAPRLRSFPQAEGACWLAEPLEVRRSFWASQKALLGSQKGFLEGLSGFLEGGASTQHSDGVDSVRVLRACGFKQPEDSEDAFTAKVGACL
ncbi:unnamed protein product [Symbiodinium natans]|uniref:Uncharacterized protein n=1 Tax=Symbiodinium natans TaxID=878477 RepID=A0A812L6M2_9DINO|nr:unnamed protein product [Symbiodinium natans]